MKKSKKKLTLKKMSVTSSNNLENIGINGAGITDIEGCPNTQGACEPRPLPSMQCK